MRKALPLSLSLIVLSGFIAACSTPVDLDSPRTPSSGTASSGSFFDNSEHRCDADPAQTLVGQEINSRTEKKARSLSGSKLVRTLRPNQVITMEYNPERINLRLDDNDIIKTVGCG